MIDFIKKIKKWISHPQLFVSFFSNKFTNLFGKKRTWNEGGLDISKKEYKTYDEYLEHQKSKLKKIEYHIRSTYDDKYHIELRNRLSNEGIIKPKMNVLCLAARLGTEVKSFLDLGCFAVGIDLNPGRENKYVVYGDFHNIQFPDKVIDVIFSNSLDHTFDLPRLIKEIKRVLKPGGSLILELGKGTDEGSQPGYYEALSWKKIDDLLKIFLQSGFSVVKKTDFQYPWAGQHISLKLSNE